MHRFEVMKDNRQHIVVLWLVAIGLHVAGWFLPIPIVGAGYEAVVIAHKQFADLLQGFPGDADIIFFASGALVTELFLLGVITVWKWPKFALRTFALSLGSTLSWQVMFIDINLFGSVYLSWLLAAAMASGLAAERLAHEKGVGIRTVLTDKIALALLLFPIIYPALLHAVDWMARS
jgi:hypothetical protein